MYSGCKKISNERKVKTLERIDQLTGEFYALMN